MNAVAPWVWKEWRAQRCFLAAYLVLAFAVLACGLLWLQVQSPYPERRAQVVLAFVAAAAAGLLLTAPMLVQREHLRGRDQLLRRLPGALAPAFWGKLLFLLLALLVLVEIGFWTAQWLLVLVGPGMADRRMVEQAVPGVWWYALGAVGAVVAVFAVAFWMPRGRMALGAAACIALLPMVAVEAVAGTCPGLGGTLDWRPWLGYLLPLAVAVGWAGGVRGCRGGDHRRSAKFGAAVLLAGLLPPAWWLGSWMREYHRPDLARMVDLEVLGTTPDGRFAIARGVRKHGWASVHSASTSPPGTVLFPRPR